MGITITLEAADGHSLSAYRADADHPKGGVVVLQEIFGVNSHIRDVADRFAQAGYTAIAPALFDRDAPGFESGYSPAEVEKARSFLKAIDWDAMVRDTEAAVTALKADGLSVAVVGFCLGGSVAYLSAARSPDVSAAVGYYGGYIVNVADEAPRCPTILHFGDRDHTIPVENVEKIRSMRPEVPVFRYDAEHGFNCDARPSYDAASADQAWTRTLAHLDANLVKTA